MKIAHASLPSDSRERTARVLAEILQGRAMPFPPGGMTSWMAWSGDGSIELEITRRGDAMIYGRDEAEWIPDNVRRWSDSHLAICVDRGKEEILAIAERAGWPARFCERGNGYFSLTEVWVDGAYLIEFLDPAQTAVYRERVTPAIWAEHVLPAMGMQPVGA